MFYNRVPWGQTMFHNGRFSLGSPLRATDNVPQWKIFHWGPLQRDRQCSTMESTLRGVDNVTQWEVFTGVPFKGRDNVLHWSPL